MSYPGYKQDYPVYDDCNRNTPKSYFNYNPLFSDNTRPVLSPTQVKVFKVGKLLANKNTKAVKSETKLFTDLRSKPVKSDSKDTPLKRLIKGFSAKKLVKVLFISMFCGICTYQVVDVFQKYSMFPISVNVVVDEMKLLKVPGITICNNNVYGIQFFHK